MNASEQGVLGKLLIEAPVDAAEQALLRKVAFRLLPVLTLAYVFNYLDRTSVSFAALTMNKAIGLSASQFGYGAGIFFIGYCIFELPSSLILYKVGARRWIARIMITWGVASAATAFVTGPDSFYLARFLLGVAEAGFFPGVTYFLSSWFPAQYRARIFAWFLLAIPVSSVIGGPICGLLLGLDGLFGLAGWQVLFIVLGLPSSLLGVAVLRLLSDRPQEAAWLAPAERESLGQILAAEPRERAKSAVLSAIRDVRVLILALIQFGFTAGSYGLGIWLPQIIKEFGFSNTMVGLISAIPYFFAAAGMIVWAWWVDRTGKKIFNLTVACLLSVIGMVLLVGSGSFQISMAGATVALIGVTSARVIFWTIPPRFLIGAGAAGGMAFINSIGLLGGFVGPSMMGLLKDVTGSFFAGSVAMAGVLVVAAILAASLKVVVSHE
jgi:MFS transporter, ACS family, tartrate transporter